MIKKLWLWLASIVKVDVVWIEKENGQWSKRRRYHPVAKATLLVCVLTIGVMWGRYFLREQKEPDETETPVEIIQSLEIVSDDFTVFSPDVQPEPSPDIYPGRIPDGLDLADDEYWLRVNKGNYKLYLYRGLDVERAYDIAVGRNPGDKERAGDNRTPVGAFTVQSIEDSRSWTYDFRDGKGVIRGAYGPWFIRLRTRWRGIGIHGTHDPDSLGTMVSEGCIRMQNSELEELKQFASANMKVVIEE